MKENMQKIWLKLREIFTPVNREEKSGSSRLLFIDLFRAWAIIFMIETHIVNQFLSLNYSKMTFIHFLNFINGMVAPSFLFITGFSFYISLSKKIDILKTLKKIFFVWGIAYALHLPYYSLKKIIFELNPTQYLHFIQADVLHCMAIGWLMILLAKVLIKNEKFFLAFLWTAGLAFVLAAPFIWKIDFGKYLPLPMATDFNMKYGSLFPVFPWLGFMFAGCIAAHFFFKYKSHDTENRFMRNLSFTGLGLFVISLLIFLVPFSFFGLKSDWGAKPYFFTARLGLAFIFLTLMFFYEKRHAIKSRIMLVTSREALGIYVWHLIVMYSLMFFGKPLGNWFYKKFNLWQAALATLALLSLMFLTAGFWNTLKTRLPKMSRILVYGFWTFFLTFILVSPK